MDEKGLGRVSVSVPPMSRPNPFASKASRHKVHAGLTLREKRTAGRTAA